MRDKIREVVKDPETAERCARRPPVRTKRICIDTDYFETYNRDNVTLVDVRRPPIVGSRRRGIGPRRRSTSST